MPTIALKDDWLVDMREAHALKGPGPVVRSMKPSGHDLAYVCVRWLHRLEDEPIHLWSELDADGNETRKVYTFADGRVAGEGLGVQHGDARLSLEPLPSIGDINADPQFAARAVTREEFERRWTELLAAIDGTQDVP